MEIECVRYEPGHRELWDDFVRGRARGTHFFFQRGYMEYHADRFTDNSLLFFEAGELVAVMPCNRDGRSLYSHQGLTYGGVIAGIRMRGTAMEEVLRGIRSAALAAGCDRLIYKPLPHIYFDTPAEDDLYWLSRAGATLLKRELSSVLALSHGRERYAKGKHSNLAKARRNMLEVVQSRDFAGFMALLAGVLQERHGVRPTHTAEEIGLLAARFPANIHLFVALSAGEVVAGLVLFLNARVAHAQYMANSDAGRELGALDLVVDEVLAKHCGGRAYFSFGVSTEDEGRRLNTGLLASKEAFGAGPMVHDTYQLDFRA